MSKKCYSRDNVLDLESCIQSWILQSQREIDGLEEIQREGTEMFKGLEGLICEGKLLELNMYIVL